MFSGGVAGGGVAFTGFCGVTGNHYCEDGEGNEDLIHKGSSAIPASRPLQKYVEIWDVKTESNLSYEPMCSSNRPGFFWHSCPAE